VIVVSVTVVSDDPNQVSKAAEVLARAAAGLALEGINVQVTMGTVQEEEDPDGQR
jgi:hypothetical protein